MEEVRNKLNIAVFGTAMEKEGGTLHFKGDAVEEFFEVFIDLTKDGVKVLSEVFNGREVREGDVDAGFAFAVGEDVRWKGVGCLKTRGEGGGYNGAEVGFYGMHDRDWPAVH